MKHKKDATEVETAVAELLTPEKLSDWNFDLFALRELAGRLYIYKSYIHVLGLFNPDTRSLLKIDLFAFCERAGLLHMTFELRY